MGVYSEASLKPSDLYQGTISDVIDEIIMIVEARNLFLILSAFGGTARDVSEIVSLTASPARCAL